VRVLAVAAAALLLAPAPRAAAAALERDAPIVVQAEGEPDPLTSVQAFRGRVPGIRPGRPRPVLYGRRVGPWLQYWMLFARDDQDLGVLRTGRREGDWELVQYRLDGGRIAEGVYAQPGGAERCGADAMRFRHDRPVVFLAHASHSAYFVRGVRDRTWPRPNDDAPGRGPVFHPALVRHGVIRIGGARRGWIRWPGRWGATRAGWVPGERSSPRGPAFAPAGAWADPAAWAAAAGPCEATKCNRLGECDLPETLGSGFLAALGLLGAALVARRRLRNGEPAATAPG
jgi:hypothetical protein